MGNLENTRRTAWEQNLVEIYKHNLMAAAGHHSYTLRDNHIADLSTRQYIRNMVGNSNEPVFSKTKFQSNFKIFNIKIFAAKKILFLSFSH